MNQSKFAFYRTADAHLFKLSGFKPGPYEFQYSWEGARHPVSVSNRSEEFEVEIPGQDCDWSPDQDDLVISRTCTVGKPSSLFSKRRGVASGDAELGLAVVLSSPKSSFRRTVPYEGSIVDAEESASLNLDFTVPPRCLRGDFKLKTVLFLKNPDTDGPPQHLSSSSGTVLGVLEQTEVFVDNPIPEFPTLVNGEGKDKPLWRLDIGWKNPLTDGFIDSVCVVLNEDNPGFEALKIKTKNRNTVLFNEIYSSAILQIISALRDGDKDAWNDTINGNQDAIEEGSVSDFVYYMMSQRFNDEGNNLVDLSYKIRDALKE